MVLNPVTRLLENRRRLATTDLYFLNAFKYLGFSTGRIRFGGSHIYHIGDVTVISRYASSEEIRNLLARKPRHVIYIADDNFSAAAEDTSLPEPYRRRMKFFVEGPWQEIKRIADSVLISSPALAHQYAQAVHYVHPFWHADAADTHHFESPKNLKLSYLGSRSHLQDLEAIKPALIDILSEFPNLTLTTWLGRFLPQDLMDTGRVIAYEPAPWWRYKNEITRHRFHLALYPLRPTTFNAARSSNKLFEHSATGAASLLSPLPTFSDLDSDDVSAAFVNGDADHWATRIRESLFNLESTRENAEATFRFLAKHKYSENTLLNFWSDVLPDPGISPQ